MAEKGAPSKESGDRLIVKEGWLQKRGQQFCPFYNTHVRTFSRRVH